MRQGKVFKSLHWNCVSNFVDAFLVQVRKIWTARKRRQQSCWRDSIPNESKLWKALKMRQENADALLAPTKLLIWHVFTWRMPYQKKKIKFLITNLGKASFLIFPPIRLSKLSSKETIIRIQRKNQRLSQHHVTLCWENLRFLEKSAKIGAYGDILLVGWLKYDFFECLGPENWREIECLRVEGLR